MSKKFFVLFISVFVLLFSVSSAMGAAYQYTLEADEESAFSEVELYPGDPEDGYTGYNYKARFRVPNLILFVYPEGEEDVDNWVNLNKQNVPYTVLWDIVSADHSGLAISERTKDASSDIVVVKGILPEATDSYEYKFSFVAKVVSIDNATHSAAVGTATEASEGTVEIPVNLDAHKKATDDELKKFIASFDLIKTVSTDYSIKIETTKDPTLGVYNEYIQSDDEGDGYHVNLPEWLTCTVNAFDEATSEENFDSKQITSITISFNQAFKDTLKNGEKAVVRVPLILKDGDTPGVVLAWDVTFFKPEPVKPTDPTNPTDPTTPTTSTDQTTPTDPTTPEATNITSKIAITDEAGASKGSKPFDSLQPGGKATYGISLAGANVTAATWAVLINGTQSHTVTPSGFLPSDAATSWVTISEATATAAKITANPPADLKTNSVLSASITGTDGKVYTVDLGTVKAATTKPLGSSGGGCDSGFGALAFALIAATLLKNLKKY